MSLEEIDITCPHCRRPYRLKVDLGVLARVRKQAVCFRCQTTFDVLSRIRARSDQEQSSKKIPTRSASLNPREAGVAGPGAGVRSRSAPIRAPGAETQQDREEKAKHKSGHESGEQPTPQSATRDLKPMRQPQSARSTHTGMGSQRLPALAPPKAAVERYRVDSRAESESEPESRKPESIAVRPTEPEESVQPLRFDLPAIPQPSWLELAEPNLDELWAKTESASESLGALLAESAD